MFSDSSEGMSNPNELASDSVLSIRVLTEVSSHEMPLSDPRHGKGAL